MRRHPQDPEGSRARAFQRWLRRDPQHRRTALKNRLERDDQDSAILGSIAVWLFVGTFLLLGIMRLATGRLFHW